MYKPIFLFGCFFINSCLFGQIVGFKESIDSIPVNDQNLKFVLKVDSGFNALIKQKVDTALLFYEMSPTINYAVLFWKKNKKFCSEAYYEYVPSITKIGNEVLQNKQLKNTNLLNIYNVLKNEDAKQIDTNVIIFHEEPLYCKFYFSDRTHNYIRQQGITMNKMDSEFLSAYTKEKLRIIKREMEKSKLDKKSR